MNIDFDAAVQAPFRMQPGLRRLAAAASQLTPLTPGSRHQREKLAVLSAFQRFALQSRPGFDATPALHALAAQAAIEHPEAWSWDGTRAHAHRLHMAVADGTVTATGVGSFGLGDEIGRCLHGLPPTWRLAGLLSLTFAEDLAIIDAGDGRIPWMAVALPSHWAPEDKVDRSFAELHAPVADNEQLLRAAGRLLALVTGHQRWERFVWNVTPHPRLHAHPRHVDPLGWPPDAGRRLPAGAWWRSERQTFMPLPDRRQAVFTIRVDTQPLATVIDTPARAAALHDAVASMTPAVLSYRRLDAMRPSLLDWLASRR